MSTRGIRATRCGLLVALAMAAACGDRARPASERPAPSAPAVGPAWFEDTVAESGIGFRHESGATGNFWFPEIATGGACLLDADSDGLLDLFFVQGGSLDPGVAPEPGHRLYRNLGGFRFEDVTERAGVAGRGTYGMGCTTGDMDGDGDDDLVVTNVGPELVLRNDGGTFTDVTEDSGIGDDEWSTSAGFIDLDADGDLDLFVSNYIRWQARTERTCFAPRNQRDYCSPKGYKAPAPDALYENLGGGKFRAVADEAGLGAAFGNGLGVTFGDFDMDGRMDVYVANDGTPNQMWINQGGLQFKERAMALGCAVDMKGWAAAGMGVAPVDIEDDGDLDLYIVHLGEEIPTLFANEGGRFRDATAVFNLAAPSRGFTGFGAGFGDFDHDGWIDIYVANGEVKYPLGEPPAADPYAQLNQVIRGTASARFEELLPRGGTAQPLYATSRAAAFGDLDDDGDIDIVVANRDAAPHVLRNIAGKQESSLTLRLRDARGLVAIGASVSVRAGERTWHRQVLVASSYLASNDSRVHVGLGAARSADAVEVLWPDGARETFGPLEAGRAHELKQGTGRP